MTTAGGFGLRSRSVLCYGMAEPDADAPAGM
jgi:hypothetical protein